MRWLGTPWRPEEAPGGSPEEAREPTSGTAKRALWPCCGTRGHRGEGSGDGANGVAYARLSLQRDAQLGSFMRVLDIHDAEGQPVHAARHLARVKSSVQSSARRPLWSSSAQAVRFSVCLSVCRRFKGAWLGGQWPGHPLGVCRAN